jgi:hypothetical protein
MHEMLEKVRKARGKDKKIQALKEFDSPELRSLLKSSFDPNIIWLLPKGSVPFEKKDYKLGDGSHRFLMTEISSLYHFVEGGNAKLRQSKREQMYIQLLECLHESEAQLMIDAKDKNLDKIYGISDPVVKEAFGWDDNYCKLS